MSRVALITGATEGIGHGAALAFAHRGWTVHVLGRNPDRAAAVLDELTAINPDQPHRKFLVDLSTIEANKRFLEQYAAEHDRLDYALLNAMVYTPKTSMTDDHIETSFAVGTLSRYLFTVKLSHLLAKAQGARLSHMTMVSGLPERVDIASVNKPGLHIFKAELQAFLSHSLMTYFFRREALTSVAIEEQDPGIVQTRQVPLHPWWFRLMLQLPRHRKDTMAPLQYGQVLAHHVENTDPCACAGRAFKKGRLVPYDVTLLDSRDHFYELMEACRYMTGISWEEMA